MTSARETQGVEPPIELRQRLRIAREYAGLDQEQLAQRMEVARSTVSNAETGKVTPRRMVVSAWALACGVSRDWLDPEPRSPHDDNDDPSPSDGLGIISPTQSASPQQTVVLKFPAAKCPQNAA